MKNDNPTYIFSHSTLLEALEEWELEQIKQFPHQAERIQIAVVAMQHFLRSKQVKDHKMLMSGEPKGFIIKKPLTLKKSGK